MTIEVKVTVPQGTNYKARVQYIDQAEGNPEGVESLAGIVPPGETHKFHAHSTRDVVVSELPLNTNDHGEPLGEATTN